MNSLREISKHWVALMGGIASVASSWISAMNDNGLVHWSFWWAGIICAWFSAYFFFWNRTKEMEASIENLNTEIKSLTDRLAADPEAENITAKLEKLIDDAKHYAAWSVHGQGTSLFIKASEEAPKWNSEVEQLLHDHIKAEVEFYENRRHKLPQQLYPDSLGSFFRENSKRVEEILQRWRQ